MNNILSSKIEKNQGRSYSLDFLKILATCGIVFHHFQQITGAMYERGINFFGEWFYWGYLVEFFFVVSGYVMYRYISKIENGEMSLMEWWLRRAKRLLPMVAVSAISEQLIWLLYLKVVGTPWKNMTVTIWGTVITSLGIQEGWGFVNPMVNNPVWYVSVLMACYIIFYILTVLATKIKCKPHYFYIMMILLGIGIITYGINLPFLNSQIARGYYSFFFGLLLAAFVRNYGITQRMLVYASFCFLFFTIIFIYCPQYGQVQLNYTLTFLVIPSLILLFESQWVKCLFQNKIWGTMSKISFEVYLWHNPMFPLMYVALHMLKIETDFSSPYSMVLFLVLSWLVGTVMYWCVEVPMSKSSKPK